MTDATTAELPELPPMPTPPEAEAAPEVTELTAGQRDYLAGIVGDEWQQAVTGTVTGWAPELDDDGLPVARLTLDVDGVELPIVVRPPQSDDDIAAAQAARAERDANHAAALEQYHADMAAWNELAAEHRAAAAQRDLDEAHAANLEQLEAEADRFRAAVDERVAEVLTAAGIAVPEGFGATYADAEASPVDEPTG